MNSMPGQSYSNHDPLYVVKSIDGSNQVSASLKTTYQVTEWIDCWASPELVQAIETHLALEATERILKNPGSTIDYGFSFHGLNTIRQSCLKEVYRIQEEEGRQPHGAELGAGFGNMTWKLLAAGARLDAFEIQEATAEELKIRLGRLSTDFWGGNQLQNILKVYVQNALTALESPDFTHKYDFIWAGNLLHFLTPPELKRLNIIFQRVLKPNGTIFAEANSPFIWNKMFENPTLVLNAYIKAQEKGLEFPGFLTINAATTVTDTYQAIKTTAISVLNSTEMDQYSVPQQGDAWAEGYQAQESFNVEALVTDYYLGVDNIVRFHHVAHFLDEITACKVFPVEQFIHLKVLCNLEAGGNLELILQKRRLSDTLELDSSISDSAEGLCDKDKSVTHTNLVTLEPYNVTFFLKKRPRSFELLATKKLVSDDKVTLYDIEKSCGVVLR
jgi:hypothetical protein